MSYSMKHTHATVDRCNISKCSAASISGIHMLSQSPELGNSWVSNTPGIVACSLSLLGTSGGRTAWWWRSSTSCSPSHFLLCPQFPLTCAAGVRTVPTFWRNWVNWALPSMRSIATTQQWMCYQRQKPACSRCLTPKSVYLTKWG